MWRHGWRHRGVYTQNSWSNTTCFLQAYKANYEGKDGWDLVAEDYAFLIPSRIPLFSR